MLEARIVEQRSEEEAEQHADDCDHHQQFDERKAMTATDQGRSGVGGSAYAGHGLFQGGRRGWRREGAED
jgi:hypothetical protein